MMIGISTLLVILATYIGNKLRPVDT
jgi:hypothetical protein